MKGMNSENQIKKKKSKEILSMNLTQDGSSPKSIFTSDTPRKPGESGKICVGVYDLIKA